MPQDYVRRYERVPFFTDLEIKDLTSGKACRGRSLDVSRGGMGFFADHFMPKGSRVRISLRLRRGDRWISVQLDAIVMRSLVEEGGAIHGVAFQPELSPATCPDLCDCLDSKLSDLSRTSLASFQRTRP